MKLNWTMREFVVRRVAFCTVVTLCASLADAAYAQTRAPAAATLCDRSSSADGPEATWVAFGSCPGELALPFQLFGFSDDVGKPPKAAQCLSAGGPCPYRVPHSSWGLGYSSKVAEMKLPSGVRHQWVFQVALPTPGAPINMAEVLRELAAHYSLVELAWRLGAAPNLGTAEPAVMSLPLNAGGSVAFGRCGRLKVGSIASANGMQRALIDSFCSPQLAGRSAADAIFQTGDMFRWALDSGGGALGKESGTFTIDLFPSVVALREQALSSGIAFKRKIVQPGTIGNFMVSASLDITVRRPEVSAKSNISDTDASNRSRSEDHYTLGWREILWGTLIVAALMLAAYFKGRLVRMGKRLIRRRGADKALRTDSDELQVLKQHEASLEQLQQFVGLDGVPSIGVPPFSKDDDHLRNRIAGVVQCIDRLKSIAYSPGDTQVAKGFELTQELAQRDLKLFNNHLAYWLARLEPDIIAAELARLQKRCRKQLEQRGQVVSYADLPGGLTRGLEDLVPSAQVLAEHVRSIAGHTGTAGASIPARPVAADLFRLLASIRETLEEHTQAGPAAGKPVAAKPLSLELGASNGPRGSSAGPAVAPQPDSRGPERRGHDDVSPESGSTEVADLRWEIRELATDLDGMRGHVARLSGLQGEIAKLSGVGIQLADMRKSIAVLAGQVNAPSASLTQTQLVQLRDVVATAMREQRLDWANDLGIFSDQPREHQGGRNREAHAIGDSVKLLHEVPQDVRPLLERVKSITSIVNSVREMWARAAGARTIVTFRDGIHTAGLDALRGEYDSVLQATGEVAYLDRIYVSTLLSGRRQFSDPGLEALFARGCERWPFKPDSSEDVRRFVREWAMCRVPSIQTFLEAMPLELQADAADPSGLGAAVMKAGTQLSEAFHSDVESLFNGLDGNYVPLRLYEADLTSDNVKIVLKGGVRAFPWDHSELLRKSGRNVRHGIIVRVGPPVVKFGGKWEGLFSFFQGAR